MNDCLAEALCQKNLLTENMEIDAEFQTTGLGLTLMTTTASFFFFFIKRTNSGELVFALTRKSDCHTQNFLAKSIIKIDGMSPVRFAAIYGILSDGSIRSLGKRRGRTPKIRI